MAELNFNPGDEVRLRLALEEIDGSVLESPDNGIILLKLKSGYNIGIPKENILAGRALKKFKSTQEKKVEIKKKEGELEFIASHFDFSYEDENTPRTLQDIPF